VWVNIKNCICDILEDIILQSLFATRMLIHESGEVKHLILVEEETFLERLGVGYPLFFALYHQ